jgi:hypothetical protein
VADLGAYDKALAWLDDQPAADGNFHALALEALIDGLGCTWAVAVAVDTRGPVVLASRCRDGESQYEPKDARPPTNPMPGTGTGSLPIWRPIKAWRSPPATATFCMTRRGKRLVISWPWTDGRWRTMRAR